LAQKLGKDKTSVSYCYTFAYSNNNRTARAGRRQKNFQGWGQRKKTEK